VTQAEFDAALRGIDPKTGEPPAQLRGREHAAAWDMIFSAPKSISVPWALSDAPERQRIARRPIAQPCWLQRPTRSRGRMGQTRPRPSFARANRGAFGRVRSPHQLRF
jgi:hypothetical protein